MANWPPTCPLALASQVLLALALPMAGWILTRNQGLLMGPFPAALWLQFAGYSILATAAVVAFQTWVSMRIPGLWGGLALAVAGAWLASRLLEGPWPTPAAALGSVRTHGHHLRPPADPALVPQPWQAWPPPPC